jgi:hypothetical protein
VKTTFAIVVDPYGNRMASGRLRTWDRREKVAVAPEILSFEIDSDWDGKGSVYSKP